MKGLIDSQQVEQEGGGISELPAHSLNDLNKLHWQRTDPLPIISDFIHHLRWKHFMV